MTEHHLTYLIPPWGRYVVEVYTELAAQDVFLYEVRRPHLPAVIFVVYGTAGYAPHALIAWLRDNREWAINTGFIEALARDLVPADGGGAGATATFDAVAQFATAAFDAVARVMVRVMYMPI